MVQNSLDNEIYWNHVIRINFNFECYWSLYFICIETSNFWSTSNLIRTTTETRLFSTLTSCIALIYRRIRTSVSRTVLKGIISLNNQQEVHLVQDDEGVFVTKEKYSKVFNISGMPKKELQETLEHNPFNNARLNSKQYFNRKIHSWGHQSARLRSLFSMKLNIFK